MNKGKLASHGCLGLIGCGGRYAEMVGTSEVVSSRAKMVGGSDGRVEEWRV